MGSLAVHHSGWRALDPRVQHWMESPLALMIIAGRGWCERDKSRDTAACVRLIGSMNYADYCTVGK